MGMFDSIYLKIKCPHCGIEQECECQTKDLDCELNVYRIGNYVGEFDDLWTLSDCSKCHKFFHVLVKFTDGIVNGEYEIG